VTGRLNREIRRRFDVVSIFPDRKSAVRLAAFILMEQDDEWVSSRRYISLDAMNRICPGRLTLLE
jgi:transposase-like protein